MRYKELTIRRELKPTEIDPDRMINIADDKMIRTTNGVGLIKCHVSGEFRYKCIYLHNDYDYMLGIDSVGSKILIPLKRK